LQLVVHDGFKEASAISSALSKAGALVKHVRKSTIATDKLSVLKKTLSANVITRWNSQVKLVRSVLGIDEEVLNSLIPGHKLSHFDRSVLTELLDVMEPFEEATDYMQGELVPTIGYVIPCVIGLRAQLNLISPRYCSRLVSTLQRSLNSRLAQYERDETFLIGALLDPRFKSSWVEPG